MEITVTTAQVLGIVLSMARMGAFAQASPITRALPATGRTAFTLALGWALATPALDNPTLSGMIVAIATNVGVGVTLGFLTGILMYAFEMAGSVMDLSSGLSASRLFDPLTGHSSAVFGRAFHLISVALWLVIGGDRLAIQGLAATIEMIPLDGSLSLSPGLAQTAISLSAQMLLVAIQVTIPAFAALMISEVAMGVASRFAPQANVFALGLPLKLLAALATVGLVVAGFPGAVSGAMDSARDVIVTTIRGLGG